MKKTLLLIVLFISTINFLSNAAADENKEWTTLVDNTKVYGYWKDIEGTKMFIQCDSNTGKETGYAFINSGHHEIKQKKVIDHYVYTKDEDFSVVSSCRSVKVENVFAPNMSFGRSWDRDYYEETGGSRTTVSGYVEWPSNRTARIVPGSDPNYWLIVAQVTNPNPYPVKADVDIDIHSSDVEFVKEDMEFAANETKYIKINDTPKERMGDEGEWDDGDWEPGWTEMWSLTEIKENLDPELPEYLKPQFGWIDSWWGFDLNLNDPEVLSNNMEYRFYLTYRWSRHNSDWMEGRVKYTKNGWKVYPNNDYEFENEDFLKEKLINWLNTTDEYPYVEDDDDPYYAYGEDDYPRLTLYEFWSMKALINDRAYSQKIYQTGPVIRGYDPYIGYNELEEYEENYGHQPCPGLRDPSIVGWHEDDMPIVDKELIFIPWYEFVSTDGDIGYLKKTMKPGYYIDDEEIPVPKFHLTTSFVDWSKEELSDGDTRYTFTFDIKINAVNESDYACKFTAKNGNIRFYMPKVRFLKNFIQYHNSTTIDRDYDRGRRRDKITTYTYYDEPEIITPEFDIVDLGMNTITIPKNSNNTVYTQRRTISFDINQRTDYDMDTPTFQRFLNDSREAAFSESSYKNYTFRIIPDDTLVGLARSEFEYKRYDWSDDDFENYTTDDYGCPSGIQLISTIHRGFNMYSDSEFYALLHSNSQRLKIDFPIRGNYFNSDFWPVAESYDPSESPDIYPKYLSLYNRDDFFSEYLSVGYEVDVDYR